MVRTATPFPMVSLLFVFTAFVISNIGHIRPQRTILAFVSGIFFILSGKMHAQQQARYTKDTMSLIVQEKRECEGVLCAQFKVWSHKTVSLVRKVQFNSVHADLVVVLKNQGLQTIKTHRTLILYSCETTTDYRLFLSRFVSIFSNYSAVSCSHCKAAWETNLSTQLSQNEDGGSEENKHIF